MAASISSHTRSSSTGEPRCGETRTSGSGSGPRRRVGMKADTAPRSDSTPTLYRQLKALPWRKVPVQDETHDRGHGRYEIRRLQVLSSDGLDFPHAAQAIRMVRRARNQKTKKWRTVTVYAITNLTARQAGPAELANYIRGHWRIEALHHIRDVTFAEDASQVRTGSGPRVMASLRNLAIGILRHTGSCNIAKALRHNARDALRPLALLGIT